MEVRLVPMSNQDDDMKGKTISEIQKDFFIDYLKEKDGKYYFKRAINAHPGDLFLFQFEGKIIASAKLKEIEEKPKGEHKGCYSFEKDTIKVFDPIDLNEFKKYVKDFKGFNQSPQKINIIDEVKFENRTNKNNNQQELNNLEKTNKSKTFKVPIIETNEGKSEQQEFTVNLVDLKIGFAKIDDKKKDVTKLNNIHRDFERETRENIKLGDLGEDLVESFEKNHLNSIGRSDLAEGVIALRKKPTAGNVESYDVESYEDDGTPKSIEVKTTTGPINNAFYISEGEVQFSERSDVKNHYYLYRLFNVDTKTKKADFVIIKGPINREMLQPLNYICSLELGETINHTKIQ